MISHAQSRRGLTLIEVLAATAILAMIAAACIPTLRAALATMNEDDPALDLHDLSNLADQIVGAPEDFGLDSSDIVHTEVAWPEHPERPPVVVTALNAPSDDDAPPDHRWLIFTSDGCTVARWMAVEAEPEESQP